MRNNKVLRSLRTNIVLVLIGFVIIFFTLDPQEKSSSPETIEPIEDVEIPAEIEGRTEQIIDHLGYTVSYNADWKIPNWVAYELTKEEAEGSESRSDSFVPDPQVAPDQSSNTSDYLRSNFDRGHLAPAGDMKWSKQAMKESFYLSNICPQNGNLNSGIWKDLETQVRVLAEQKGSIYVVCGPIVSDRPKTIGANDVAIPDAFFKVLLQNDDNNWYSIAFMFANKNGKKPLSTYAMSVEELQTITAIDFFPALPDSVEQIVESQVDFTKWNIESQK